MQNRRTFLTLSAAGLLGSTMITKTASAKLSSQGSDAGAMLFIANDVKPGREKDFNYWYQTQHLDERLGIPGFLSARRYKAVKGEADREYLATYETESSDTLKAHQYMKRLNDPTVLTKENMQKSFARMNRSLLDIKWTDGKGVGTIMDLIVIEPDKDTLQKLKANAPELWQKTATPAFEKATYMERAYAGDKQTISAETKLRGGPDEEFDGVLLLEWADVPSWPAPRIIDKLKALGIKVNEQAGGRYRLMGIRG